MFLQMNNVKDVMVCAASFLDPRVINGLSQGLKVATAVGIDSESISLYIYSIEIGHVYFCLFQTVPFIPGATLALALISLVFEKTKQVVENDAAAQELRTECEELTKSVTKV